MQHHNELTHLEAVLVNIVCSDVENPRLTVSFKISQENS